MMPGMAAGTVQGLGPDHGRMTRQAIPAWGQSRAWVGSLGCPPCRHQQVPARRFRRSRPVAASAQLAQQPQQVLDMDYMRRVYKETQLSVHDDGASPVQRSINTRILRQLRACTSIAQLQRIVSKELPSMSAQTIAKALIIAVYGPLPQQQQKQSLEQSQLAATGATTKAGRQQHGQQQQGSQPRERQQMAVQVVETLVVQLAEGLQRKQLTVHVSQVVTAVMCSGRVWGHGAPPAGAQPTPQTVTGNRMSVAAMLDMGSDVIRTRHARPTVVDAALHVLLQHARPSLFVCTPSELSRLAQGLAYLQLPKQAGAAADMDTWMDSFVKVVQSKMFQMDGLQLGTVAWSLARLGYQPSDYWLSSLLTATQPLLSTLEAVPLSNLLWALCKWEHHPGAEWREAASAALVTAVDSMRPKCLAAALTAVQRLQTQPSSALLRACTARLVEVANDMTPAQDCQVLYALMRMQYLPDEEQFVAYIQAMQARLQHANAQQLVTLLWALARIGFMPSHQWRGRWVEAARAKVRHMQAHDIARVLGAYVSWRPATASVRPPRPLMQDLCELMLAQARAEQLPAQTAGQLLLYMARLRIPPPRQLLRELLLQLGTDAKLQADDGNVMQQVPAPTQHDAPKAAALVTARLLGDIIITLPSLLRLYKRQQLLQSQQVVAVVMAGDSLVTAGIADLNGAAAGERANPGHHAHDASLSHLDGSDVGSFGHANGTAPHLQPGPLPWHMQPRTQAASVRRFTSVKQASSSSADTDGAAASTLPAARSMPRHAAADVVDLLLPAPVAVPLMRAVQARLHIMELGQLILLLEALAGMRLSPGRDFLIAHVRAIAPHLAAMKVHEKLRVDAAYQVLSQDPTCTRLDERQAAQQHH